MTQPNDFQPTTAANYGSLSTWSQKTQGDWQAGISAGFAGPLNGIGGFFTMVVSTIASIVSAIAGVFLGGIGIIGGIVTGIIGAVASFFGALFGGFTGTTAPNNQASAFDVHLGADGLRKTVTELQSDVQTMKFDQLPPGGGVFIDSAVTLSDTDWGPNFTVSGDGTVKVVAPGVFSWAKSGKVSRQKIGIYNHETASDLQVVGIIFHTLPQAGASNLALGRVADANNYVYLRVYNNKVELGCYVAGVKHVFETALGSPSPGSLWELQCGTESDDYNILVFQNRSATAIIDYRDTGHVSQLGSGSRGGAQAMISAGGATEYVPGQIMQFSFRDIAPPPIQGTGLRVRNLSATPISMPGGGIISSVPNGYYDSVDYCSSDIDWDASLTQATIHTEGLYELKFALLFNSYYSSVQVYASHFQNAAAGIAGPVLTSGGTQSQIKSVLGTFTTYCLDGDTILPALAIVTSGALGVRGDTAGFLSWLTLTKVG